MEASNDEFPPLWPAGFHSATVEDLRRTCVERFPLSETREELHVALELVMDVLRDAQIEGEIWLDGSFVTEKIDPSDVDFILVLQSNFYDSASAEQMRLVDSLADGDLWKPPLHCDTNYVILDTERQEASPQPINYWKNRFGLSTVSKTPKGIIVIGVAKKKGETDEASAFAEPVA